MQIILGVFCAIVMCLNAGGQPVNFAKLSEQLLSMISDPSVSQADLEEAIARLGNTSETPEFWNRIITDPKYRTNHRQICAIAFFRRHVQKLGTLWELQQTLRHSKWITCDNVSIDFGSITGYRPVEFKEDDTVFRISGFTGKEDRTTAVYIRIFGKNLSVDAFCSYVLQGQKDDRLAQRLVAEYGYTPSPASERNPIRRK